jgi:DNA invertase Pin-like site-specific DNA recombinase
MRVAVYLRISTDQQSHDSQRLELEDYCKRRGWEGIRWFTDTASGAKSDPEGLAGLMDLVRRGKVDAVVTFKLDRLARSLCHLAQLIAELQAHRVALVCSSRGIDNPKLETDRHASDKCFSASCAI